MCVGVPVLKHLSHMLLHLLKAQEISSLLPLASFPQVHFQAAQLSVTHPHMSLLHGGVSFAIYRGQQSPMVSP